MFFNPQKDTPEPKFLKLNENEDLFMKNLKNKGLLDIEIKNEQENQNAQVYQKEYSEIKFDNNYESHTGEHDYHNNNYQTSHKSTYNNKYNNAYEKKNKYHKNNNDWDQEFNNNENDDDHIWDDIAGDLNEGLDDDDIDEEYSSYSQTQRPYENKGYIDFY